jgi:kinesin family protein 6/9
MRLVDLAGSERIGHVDAGDIVFNEGRSINLSLHYLEQVIVALNEKITNQRKHIPYRNSVLTWILKDSLGGNSRSALIATISMEIEHVAESISTCRFATRVSLVQNFPVVNQIVDTKIIIDRLSKENEFLRSQLSNQTGYNSRVILSDEDMSNLRQRVEYFLRRPEPNEFSCGSREEVGNLIRRRRFSVGRGFMANIPPAL